MAKHPIQNLAIAYIHFYVDELSHWQNWFKQILNLNYVGKPEAFCHVPEGTIQLQTDGLTLLLSAPHHSEDAVAQYLQKHPCGVADIAFFVEDLSYFGQLENNISIKKLVNPAGFQHSLIQSKIIPKLNHKVDHLVLNVPQGYLDQTVGWYKEKFGFQQQQSFTIQTNYSGLSSQVIKHPSGIQFPINQPDNIRSQIQEFLDYNHGAGIQHIAINYANLPDQIHQLRQRGLTFLDVPQTYYQKLASRYPHLKDLPQWQKIQREKVLVDVVKSPKEMLLQIFTQPIFKEPTFFWEFIERKQQAQGFGEGNFQALFEAIEQAQKQRLNLLNPLSK